jgi:hypothetical protein
MLEYIVQRASRRKLLFLLWGEGTEGSASDFSKLAEIPYATAHKELHFMEQVALVKPSRTGGSIRYSANVDHPKARELRSLFGDTLPIPGALPAHETAEKETLGHLKLLGAPLLADGTVSTSQSAEETLVQGLALSHRNTTVANVLPLVLWLNRNRIHFPKLELAARRAGEQKALGFFLAVAAELSGEKKLRSLAMQLMDRRWKKTEDFFTSSQSPFSKKLAERNTPRLARKWKYRMNLGMDSFEGLFRKFAPLYADL